MARYSKFRRDAVKEQSRQMRLTDDAVASQVLSEQSLLRDRATTSKEIVFDKSGWEGRTNVVDYRGADVKRASISAKRRKSVEDLVDDPVEAQRILEYVTGVKNKSGEHKIVDFETFKEAFRQEFLKGGRMSNARLWDVLGGQEDLLLKLYADTKIQEKVTKDSRGSKVSALAKRFNISDDKANRLFEQMRIHEIQLVQEGMLPQAERQVHRISETISPTRPPAQIRISQRRGDIVYQRAKPIPFTQPELRFLQNNMDKGIPTRKLTAQFNILFSASGRPARTQNSIYNKVYRLSRLPDAPNLR